MATRLQESIKLARQLFQGHLESEDSGDLC